MKYVKLPLRRIFPVLMLAAVVFPSPAPGASVRVAAQRPQPAPVVLPMDDPKVVETPEAVVEDAGSGQETITSDEPANGPPPCTPKLASALPQIPAATSGDASAIVYGRNGNVYLYDVAADRATSVTDEAATDQAGPDTCQSSNPAFLSDHEIIFLSDWGRTLFRLNLWTGRMTAVLRSAAYANAFSLSPDGKWFAYLTDDAKSESPEVRAVSIDGTTAKLIKGFPEIFAAGRCGGPEDEISISWSPDGTMLLLVATHFVAKEGDHVSSPVATMYVLGMDGTIIGSRVATHPRWSPDSGTVYYQTFDQEHEWRVLDVETMKDSPVPMRTGTSEIAVSPGGGLIAHAAGGLDARVYVYDVTTHQEQLVATKYAGPLWLASRALAVAKVALCEECMDGWYETDGTAWLSAAGGRAHQLKLATTRDADVWFG